MHLMRCLSLLLAATCVGAFTAGPQLTAGCQLLTRRPAVLTVMAAAPEEEEDVPELIMPPSRPGARALDSNWPYRLLRVLSHLTHLAPARQLR